VDITTSDELGFPRAAKEAYLAAARVADLLWRAR
jgi:hypothetical protein